MGLLFWKKTSTQVEAFAMELASDFFGHVSPDTLNAYFADRDRDKKSRKGVELQIHSLALRLNQFRELHKIGVYGKAKFHQVFMARLDELGYEDTAG